MDDSGALNNARERDEIDDDVSTTRRFSDTSPLLGGKNSSPPQKVSTKEKPSRPKDPSTLSFTFSSVNGLIRKCLKAEGNLRTQRKEGEEAPVLLTAADLNPLATWLHASVILDSFHTMMKDTIVHRAPKKGCWFDDTLFDSSAPAEKKVPRGDFMKRLGLATTDGKEEDFFSFEKPFAPLVVDSVHDRLQLYMAQGYSLFGLIFRFALPHITLSIGLAVVSVCSTVLQIWSLWTIILMVNGEGYFAELAAPYQYAIALCFPLSALMISEVMHNTFLVSARTGYLIRSVATGLIFDKMKLLTPLHLGTAAEAVGGKEGEDGTAHSSSSSDATTSSASVGDGGEGQHTHHKHASISSGKLLNLAASDADALIEAFFMTPFTVTSLVEIVLGVVWIWWIVGWAAGPLCGAVVLLLAPQVYFGHRVSITKEAAAEAVDGRLRALTEFLTGVQVVKFYAWEQNVRKTISAVRKAEARLHLAANVWIMVCTTNSYFAGAICSVVLFAVKGTYDETMKASDVFVTMALIDLVNQGFSSIPHTLSGIGSARASFRRIQSFLSLDVTSGRLGTATTQPQRSDADAKVSLPTTAAARADATTDSTDFRIVGSYGWPGFTVKNADLSCAKGTLTVITGPVGSGKSTLLQAILGVCSVATTTPTTTSTSPPSSSSPQQPQRPLIRLPGGGRIAYVAQEAFILEATVRENICFGLPYDADRYREVLKACSLITDLKQWGGDLVEVTGATLSGGQRQRLSLARACYADADLYLIDDPISAVDASVGLHLLRRCFRGILREKTVLLATHHPAPARFADQVVAMDHGVLTTTTPPPSSVLSPTSAVELSTAEEAANVTTDPVEQSVDATVAQFSPTEAAAGGQEEKGKASHQSAKEDEDALLDEFVGKSRALQVKEVAADGAVTLSVYATYVRGGGWCWAGAALVLFLITQGTRSVQDWWFAAWTSRTFESLDNDQYLYILAAMIGFLIFISLLRTVIFGIFAIGASSSLHDGMFEAVIASPLHFFEQVPIGRIMNRFSKDLDYCDNSLTDVLFELLQDGLTVVGALVLLVYSIPWFALALPAAFALGYLLVRAYTPTSRFVKRVEGASRSPTINTFQAVASGLTTLRAYGRLDHFQQLFLTYSDETTNALLHNTVTNRWIALRMDLVAVGWICVATMLCIGLKDSLGPSIVGLCLSQSLTFMGLLQYSVRMAAETEKLMTSVERLDEYSRLPPEENKGTIVAADAFTSHTAVEEGSRTSLPHLWPAGCDIVVKGLTLAYASNPNTNVLKNLHFTIKAGQRVAVVGRTGAGKSSLLAAFYRTVAIPDGSIAIGGVPTTAIDVFCLRSKMGIIPQVPTLFHGTFRYNLDPFGLYSDTAMLEALAKVRLLEYVKARSGLDTTVGDNGGSLSVGQRQLLCAARVLLTGASILFMDEATANIDEETDAQIQQIIREEASRRQMTVITIAHRLNTIMDYDLVLVMSQGRLVEYGNPQALVDADAAMRPVAAELPVVAEENAEFSPSESESPCGNFTTNVQVADEVRVFARMARAMNDAHAEGV